MSSLEPGARVEPHYVVLARLGHGGMGVVYRARDERLGREVALKVLSRELASDANAWQRLMLEARTASSLSHPNIVAIYDIAQTYQLQYIAEELVPGVTLRQRLDHGRLGVDDALAVAIQVASALAATHGAGIIHRDIKPENLMMRPDGLVKVLDFGLAKITDTSPDAATGAYGVPTDAGIVRGTVSYMSPEQARGLPLDGRTDLFSLGVVLYEMLAGRRPFSAATSSDTMIALLRDEPPALDVLVPEVSPELARIVSKALRKSTDERYQRADDLLADLKAEQSARSHLPRRPMAAATPFVTAPGRSRARAWAVGAVAAVLVTALAAFGIWRMRAGTTTLTEKDTILLADFENTTGESVFDGSTLRQALLVQLQQTPFLNVFPDQATATTLAMMERKPDERVTGAVAREICLRQQLTVLIAGSIAKLGEHYIVTLHATDPRSGTSMAVQQREAANADHVLGALGDAAAGLREQLGESAGTRQKYNTPIEQATTSSLAALRAYSEGMRYMQRENGRAALPFFLRAIQIDPDFVAAYDSGAWAHAIVGNPGKSVEFSTEGYRRRQRATELEQLSVTETYHHFSTGDYEEEIKTADVWARLFPNDWTPYPTYALDYPALGRLADSVDAGNAIIRLNPHVAQGYRFLVTALVPLERYDEARQAIARAATLDLGNVFTRRAELTMAVALNDSAATENALTALRQNEGVAEELTWRARLAAAEGRWHNARDIYRGGEPGRAQPVLPLEAVGTQALLGMCDPEDGTRALSLARIVSPLVTFSTIDVEGSLCGDVAAAEAFATELEKRFPASTIARALTLPQLRAAIAMRRNRPELALELLGTIRAEGSVDAYRSYYLRGQANLKLHRYREAIADFRMVLNHRGWSPYSTLQAMSRLGEARGLAASGDTVGARESYRQLLSLWKNADPDLPVVRAARAEAEKL